MILKMLFRQMTWGARLTMIGGVLLAMGVLLMLVRLVMILSYLAGLIVLVGLIVLLVGIFLGKREKGRRNDFEDEIPYL